MLCSLKAFVGSVDKMMPGKSCSTPTLQNLFNGSKLNNVNWERVGMPVLQGLLIHMIIDSQEPATEHEEEVEMDFTFYKSASARKRTATAEEKERALNTTKAFERLIHSIGFWENEKARLDYRPVHMNTLDDECQMGEIPVELSKYSQLKIIDFSLNCLNGTIPDELGELENLEQLIAWFNGFEAKIPPKLGQCKNLKDLILNNNHLSGGIPIELFNCSNLEWISLISNELIGEIPPVFGLLIRLAVLQLGNNNLTGEIPAELPKVVATIMHLAISTIHQQAEAEQADDEISNKKTQCFLLSL
ncbi:hypothetical protein RJT34_13551 [Clitoria ternatea]|uniref:Uncharacterized protein n=1 Tax=Clitoria ternatea TaxID=43366 RepID=A0AAN9PLU7_CLITE